MDNDDIVHRFNQISKKFDKLHSTGAWLELKHELGLGSGRFNDRLTTDELRELNAELEHRL